MKILKVIRPLFVAAAAAVTLATPLAQCGYDREPIHGGAAPGTASTSPQIRPSPSATKPLELYDDFSNKSNVSSLNGVHADSGQTYTASPYPTDDTDATPQISSGTNILSGTEDGGIAGYLSATLSGSATYLEADFSFGNSGTTQGEALALAAWVEGYPDGGGAAISPAHVVFHSTGYEYGVFTGFGVYHVVDRVPYPDITGKGRQHVEVAVDAANSLGYVRGPDGVVNTFSDPQIGAAQPAPYVTCEITYSNASTDSRVAVNSWEASSERARAHELHR
jgi:hypothetical protein